jgi:hypothetical protein
MLACSASIDLVKTTLKMALDRQRDKESHDDIQP